MTSHMLTVCTVASLLLVGQYARLLLANEVTNEVPVPSVNYLYWQTWVRLTWKINTLLNIVEMFLSRLKRDSPVGKFFVFFGSVLLFMVFVWIIRMIEKRMFILDVSQEWKLPPAITFSFSTECRWVRNTNYVTSISPPPVKPVQKTQTGCIIFVRNPKPDGLCERFFYYYFF